MQKRPEGTQSAPHGVPSVTLPCVTALATRLQHRDARKCCPGLEGDPTVSQETGWLSGLRSDCL